MRSLIVSLVIAGLIVSGTIFSTRRIEKESGIMLDKNRQVMEAVKASDYENAKRLALDMAEYIDEKKITMSIIMDHGELDKIEQGIAELQGYIEGEAKFDSIAKCRFLDVLIRHMPRNYKLKIENIL